MNPVSVKTQFAYFKIKYQRTPAFSFWNVQGDLVSKAIKTRSLVSTSANRLVPAQFLVVSTRWHHSTINTTDPWCYGLFLNKMKLRWIMAEKEAFYWLTFTLDMLNTLNGHVIKHTSFQTVNIESHKGQSWYKWKWSKEVRSMLY